MILEIGSKGFVGPSIFWPLKMGLKRRKVENHWLKGLNKGITKIEVTKKKLNLDIRKSRLPRKN